MSHLKGCEIFPLHLSHYPLSSDVLPHQHHPSPPVSLSYFSFLLQFRLKYVILTGNSEFLAESCQLLCWTPSPGSTIRCVNWQKLGRLRLRTETTRSLWRRHECGGCLEVGGRCGKSPTENDQLGAHSAGPACCHGLFGLLLLLLLFIEPRLLRVRNQWCTSAPRPHKPPLPPRLSCCIPHTLTPWEGSPVPSDYGPCV